MPGRTLHVLHVTAPGAFGGLESVVLALAEGMHSRGHRVTVAAAVDGNPDHPFVNALRERSVAPFLLPPGHRSEVRAIRDFTRLEGVDIVHSHGYRSDVTSLVAGRGRRLVSTVHGFTGGGWKNRLYEWLQIRALRRFDAVLPVSSPLLALLREGGVETARLHCVPNAYRPRRPLAERGEARRLLGVPAEGRVIGWAGRLSYEKGADLALRALAGLPDRSWQAVFLGDGSELAALRELADELGIGSRVAWAGAVPDAGALFGAFDVFLLSSRTEGTPMVLLEAMAAGVAIAATTVGGVPDMLAQGEAWLVEPGDTVGLTAALDLAMKNPAMAAQRAALARVRLDHSYDPKRWLDRHETIYGALLEERLDTVTAS